MNKLELSQLLTVASGIDNRTVTPDVVEIWFPILQDIDYDVAVEAMQMHYRESTDWLMPAIVRRNASRVLERRDRERRMSQPAIARKEITFDRAEFDRMVQESIEKHRAEKS